MIAERTSGHPTFNTYLRALNDRTTSVLSAQPDVSDPAVVRELVGYTWEVSLDQLAADGNRLARPVLQALSLLGDAPVGRARRRRTEGPHS